MGKNLFMSICFMLLILANGHMRVCAQAVYSEMGDTISVQSVLEDDDECSIKVSEAGKNSAIKVTCDNTEIVGFSYRNREKHINVINQDQLEVNGDSCEFKIVPRKVGVCNVTVSVNGTVDKTWQVTVNPTKPGVSLSSKQICSSDDTVEITFKGLKEEAEVRIKANKALICYYIEGKKVAINKKYKKLDTKKLGLKVDTNRQPISKGNRKFSLEIKQEGQSYKYVLNLKVKNYECPYQSFMIGNDDLTKEFKKHRLISDYLGAGISVKKAKSILNVTGNGKPFTIKMKKGYSIYSITYTKRNEYGDDYKFRKQSYTQKNGIVRGTLDKDFLELRIDYKKGKEKGRTWFYFTSNVTYDLD